MLIGAESIVYIGSVPCWLTGRFSPLQRRRIKEFTVFASFGFHSSHGDLPFRILQLYLITLANIADTTWCGLRPDK